MKQNKRLAYLFKRYLDKTYTALERDELLNYVRQSEHDEYLRELIQESWSQEFKIIEQDPHKAEAIFQHILNQSSLKTKVRKIPVWHMVAAASVILVFSAVSYFMFLNADSNEKLINHHAHIQDITPPNTARATITLANGQQISLDSAGQGTLATQGNIQIMKLDDGQVIYKSSDKKDLKNENEVLYNTLTNPRGSKVVSLVLQDGTKIWLNAESSLRYPNTFVGKERRVEITGEAYFEVAQNAARTFKVDVGKTVITVISTRFNVNSYYDKMVGEVTLLEGKVRVNAGLGTQLLSPGQQAQIHSGGQITLNKEVDTEQVLAWKTGTFVFNGSDIKSIMKQVARWYDVEIVYESEIQSSFVAKISRDVPVSELLKLLEMTELVKFKIEGKKIRVMK